MFSKAFPEKDTFPDIRVCESVLPGVDDVAQAEADIISVPVAERLAEIFRALADPTRVRMIAALLHSELCVGDLAEVLGMSQSAVSHQLRLLRDLRLVRTRRIGKQVFYALDDAHIHDLYHRGLEHVTHG